MPDILSMPVVSACLITALLVDKLLGEPPTRLHPLVWFGKAANWVEQRYNTAPQQAGHSYLLGMLAWAVMVLPPTLLAVWLCRLRLGWLADVALLYFAIGANSLNQHAMQVFTPLQQGNIAQARQAAGYMVSRDTANLTENEIAKATIESVLENGNDAIFGAIFWFVIFSSVGAAGAGAVLFRLANTLDAMWGYRTPQFNYFGWAAARLDDALGFVPARLTALSYALCRHTLTAFKCWFSQAKTWYSPNAGPVMAAGAGALNVQLGGVAVYHGVSKTRPILGMGEPAKATHIFAAVKLVQRSITLWLACIFLLETLINNI